MKNKTEEDQLEQSVPKIDTRIAAVRDLIFGENIQQYNTEFEDVYERITSLETTTKQNLAKAVDALETKLSDLESLMDHKFQDLNSDLDKKLEPFFYPLFKTVEILRSYTMTNIIFRIHRL